jgi:oligoendopeptidase F
VDEVQDLARCTGEEVANWRQTLDGHTKLLNAIRKDHVDQSKRLDKLEAEMRNGFGELAKGQELITGLLTRHLNEPDEETRAGGADE